VLAVVGVSMLGGHQIDAHGTVVPLVRPVDSEPDHERPRKRISRSPSRDTRPPGAATPVHIGTTTRQQWREDNLSRTQGSNRFEKLGGGASDEMI
jgi:hypothetical protein